MYETSIAPAVSRGEWYNVLAVCYTVITDRPVLEETGIVIKSALSNGGGLFLLEANQTTPSASGADHAFVIKIRDENGQEHYQWQVPNPLSLSLVTNHCCMVIVQYS